MTRDEFIKKYEEVWDKEYMDCWHYRFLKDNKSHKYTQITKEYIARYNYQPIEILDENKAEDRKILEFLNNTQMASSFNDHTLRCIDPKTNHMLFTYGFFRPYNYEIDENFITHGFYYMGYSFVFEIDINESHYDIAEFDIPNIFNYKTFENNKDLDTYNAMYRKEAEKFYKKNKQKILHEFKVAIAANDDYLFNSNYDEIDEMYFGF